MNRRQLILGAAALSFVPTVLLAREAHKWDFGPTIFGKDYSYDENGNPIRMRERDDGALEFTFPKSPGQIDYLTKSAGDGFADARSVRLVYTIQGRGKLVPVGKSYVPARVRLFFQRKGDNWYGNGGYQYYRFWSKVYGDLEVGTDVELECRLDHDFWTGVYGQSNQDGFNSAQRNAARLGMTFGGTYAGHGVRAKEGEPSFVIKEFRVL